MTDQTVPPPPPSWMKTAAVVDGVLMAAVLALGQGVPQWAPYCTVAAQFLGVLGTIFGVKHGAAS